MTLIELTDFFDKCSKYKNAEVWIHKFRGLISKLNKEFYLYYSPEHKCLSIEYIFLNFNITIDIYEHNTIIAKYHKDINNLLVEDFYKEEKELNFDLINTINEYVNEINVYEKSLYEN
jgi:hypothetical protein